MSYKVIIELDWEEKPDVEDILEYINELGNELGYELIDNAKQQKKD